MQVQELDVHCLIHLADLAQLHLRALHMQRGLTTGACAHLQVQELDVHCLIHVADLARLWACVLGPCDTILAQVVAELAGWSLDLSCTVMGVCIYRVARKQTAPGAAPRELEKAVHRLCAEVHAVLAELLP